MADMDKDAVLLLPPIDIGVAERLFRKRYGDYKVFERYPDGRWEETKLAQDEEWFEHTDNAEAQAENHIRLDMSEGFMYVLNSPCPYPGDMGNRRYAAIMATRKKI